MRYRRSWGSRIFDGCNLLFMLCVFALMAYPFWHIICYSFSNSSQLTGGLLFWPRGFTTASYQLLFGRSDTVNGLIVSLLRAFIATFLSTIVTSASAYALTKAQAPGIRFLRKYFVMVMYVSGGLIPSYLVVRYVGLVGSFWVYVIPGLASSFGMLLTRTFIEALPSSLEESALIDGASEPRAFASIIFPLCMPIVMALGMFTFIGQWNAYFDTMLYNFMERKLYTLQYILYMALSSTTATTLEQAQEMGLEAASTNPQSVIMSITVITIIPILVLYPFVQKHIKSGILVGAIKA